MKKKHLQLAFACKGGGIGNMPLHACNRQGGSSEEMEVGVQHPKNMACLPGQLHVSSSAMMPSVGSWSPSYRGSSTTQASYGLVLLARDGAMACQDNCMSPAQCHNAICWQLEPVMWGSTTQASYGLVLLARDGQLHRLWLPCALMGHVGDGRNMVVVVEEYAWHSQYEHLVT